MALVLVVGVHGVGGNPALVLHLGAALRSRSAPLQGAKLSCVVGPEGALRLLPRLSSGGGRGLVRVSMRAPLEGPVLLEVGGAEGRLDARGGRRGFGRGFSGFGRLGHGLRHLGHRGRLLAHRRLLVGRLWQRSPAQRAVLLDVRCTLLLVELKTFEMWEITAGRPVSVEV